MLQLSRAKPVHPTSDIYLGQTACNWFDVVLMAQSNLLWNLAAITCSVVHVSPGDVDRDNKTTGECDRRCWLLLEDEGNYPHVTANNPVDRPFRSTGKCYRHLFTPRFFRSIYISCNVTGFPVVYNNSRFMSVSVWRNIVNALIKSYVLSVNCCNYFSTTNCNLLRVACISGNLIILLAKYAPKYWAF